MSHLRLLPDRSLPLYSYVPGKSPHPHRDPLGHSFGVDPPRASFPTDVTWRHCDQYLWGIDLFNCGYFWEAHESWEQVWHACGREGDTAKFLKGLIKLAAAGVKAREGRTIGVQRHADRARHLFQELLSQRGGKQPQFLGMSLTELVADAIQLGEQSQSVINTSDQPVVRLMPFSLRVQGLP